MLRSICCEMSRVASGRPVMNTTFTCLLCAYLSSESTGVATPPAVMTHVARPASSQLTGSKQGALNTDVSSMSSTIAGRLGAFLLARSFFRFALAFLTTAAMSLLHEPES